MSFDHSRHYIVAIDRETGQHMHVPLPDLVREAGEIDGKNVLDMTAALDRLAALEERLGCLLADQPTAPPPLPMTAPLPRVPAVAPSPPDLSSLQRALVSDMERIAHGRPEHIQRDLAVIAAEVSAARSLDEIEACRQRALAYVEAP